MSLFLGACFLLSTYTIIMAETCRRERRWMFMAAFCALTVLIWFVGVIGSHEA